MATIDAKDTGELQGALAQRAAQCINDFFLKNGNTPVLFLVSGGSAFEVLRDVRPSLFSPETTVGVLDERYSTDPTENNFAQLTETSFYRAARQTGTRFFDTRVRRGETQESLRGRFEENLKTWKQAHPTGKIVILQGIGEDGHTAGIIPGAMDPARFNRTFDNPDIWAAAYDAGDKNPFPKRVTTTLPFLRQVDLSVVYATGQKKGSAVLQTFMSIGSLFRTPARVIRELQTLGKVRLFTDQRTSLKLVL